MSHFAIIKNNIVDNVIVADSLEDANVLGDAVELTMEHRSWVSKGYFYDAETNTFTNMDLEQENA